MHGAYTRVKGATKDLAGSPMFSIGTVGSIGMYD